MQDSKSAFDCDTCTEKDNSNRNCLNHKRLPEELRAVDNSTLIDRDNAKDIKEALQEHGVDIERGRTIPLSNGKDNLRLYECPVTYITQDTNDLMRVLYLTENSDNLLFKGGIADQPYWFIEAIEIFKSESFYLTEKRQKEWRQENSK